MSRSTWPDPRSAQSYLTRKINAHDGNEVHGIHQQSNDLCRGADTFDMPRYDWAQMRHALYGREKAHRPQYLK